MIQDPVDPSEAMTDDGRMMAKVFFTPLDGTPPNVLQPGTHIGWIDPDGLLGRVTDEE